MKKSWGTARDASLKERGKVRNIEEIVAGDKVVPSSSSSLTVGNDRSSTAKAYRESSDLCRINVRRLMIMIRAEKGGENGQKGPRESDLTSRTSKSLTD